MVVYGRKYYYYYISSKAQSVRDHSFVRRPREHKMYAPLEVNEKIINFNRATTASSRQCVT